MTDIAVTVLAGYSRGRGHLETIVLVVIVIAAIVAGWLYYSSRARRAQNRGSRENNP